MTDSTDDTPPEAYEPGEPLDSHEQAYQELTVQSSLLSYAVEDAENYMVELVRPPVDTVSLHMVAGVRNRLADQRDAIEARMEEMEETIPIQFHLLRWAELWDSSDALMKKHNIEETA